jgi:hypothetical protein
MQRGSLLRTCAMCVIASVASSLGCAHTMSSESTRIRQATWHADLDDYQEVRLSISRVHNRDDGAPARTFEQLTLEVRPRPHLQFESILKSVEFTPGARGGQLGFDEIEVRADESRSRVWFVDRATGLGGRRLAGSRTVCAPIRGFRVTQGSLAAMLRSARA